MQLSKQDKERIHAAVDKVKQEADNNRQAKRSTKFIIVFALLIEVIFILLLAFDGNTIAMSGFFAAAAWTATSFALFMRVESLEWEQHISRGVSRIEQEELQRSLKETANASTDA